MTLEEAEKLLISPYWNVNLRNGNFPGFTLGLLISPYWNVNIN